MAERTNLLRTIGRSASTDSTEYSITMGKSVRRKSKKAKPKERWLLTRKTWRYMADAGRKLIPDGAHNRPEDIPKIEAYFQEVCKKEPRFLLWRKNSYPGAIGFRRKKMVARKGGSCRKAISADEVGLGIPQRPTYLAIEPSGPGKFDIRKMRDDFLNADTPVGYSSYDKKMGDTHEPAAETDDKQLISMLEQYLNLQENASEKPTRSECFNYQELIDKLQRHLTYSPDHSYSYVPSKSVSSSPMHVQADPNQKCLIETINRYYGQSGKRDKVVSDLLTDRKALEKLYFELRKAKGFRGSRGGTGYTTTFAYGTQRSNYENTNKTTKPYDSPKFGIPPPLIEVESEVTSVVLRSLAVQTVPIPEDVLNKIEEEYKKQLIENRYDDEPLRDYKPSRRRSSLEDDISQSVSNTIKRYLRMARKKSVETDKAEGFKRVNYDRNLRNIKAKGEITKPGDDDGLNKGCQTDPDWILNYRSLKFAELCDASDVESRFSSTRSSIDAELDDTTKSLPCSPPSSKSTHSFLSNLLHHHSKHDKHIKSPTAVSTTVGPMQKSKSSSSVMHHGSRLVARKIFRSRSKSQTRPSQTSCSWTPQGSCVWNNATGRQVVLNDSSLLNLTDIERKILQKVAIAKLQALNLGVNVKVPNETITSVSSKPKRRPYLLKRKALTTSIFDGSRKENEKDGKSTSGGLVFGIPLSQCVENDRIARAAGASPFRSNAELTAYGDEPSTMNRHGSRSSFSSLIDSTRNDEKGSCENLMLRSRMVGSVPGLLDTLSCGSIADLASSPMEEECAVPNILNECIRHLEQHGLNTLGIFRVSTSKKRIRQLREDFDCGKETTLEDEQCPHDVATLLKEYLRDLPDPLLCRDLYQAFVQTQRIRHRKLQLEALQHLVQLLPPPNRDTLFTLLNFLSLVAQHADDTEDESGDVIAGNKMDSSNLATVFAPNILHCIKPGSKDTSDRPEDRTDIINVVRTLIDHFKFIFHVPATLLDEIYIHMMDSHPEALDQLLNKKDAMSGADESVDELDSESFSNQWTPTASSGDIPFDGNTDLSEQKRTYSREECLHEAAATGGPNIGMRRHKDRIRERSSRKRREKNEEGSLTSSAMNIISKLRGQKEDEAYPKNRSSSLESNSSLYMDSDPRLHKTINDEYDRRKSSPYILDNSGVITASLTIPVQKQSQPNQSLSYGIDEDIPYIEDVDSGKHQLTIGVVRTPSVPPRTRHLSVGSDSSITSTVQPLTGSISIGQSYDSAMGSSVTTHSSSVHNTPNSVSSSVADHGTCSSPPSWGASPPASPDSYQTSVNYIPDDLHHSKMVATKSNKNTNITKDNEQKVSLKEIQQGKETKESKDPSRSFLRELSFTKTKQVNTSESVKFSSTMKPKKLPEREPRFTPSITSIGNAVLRSKTADFERIIKTDSSKPKSTSTTTTTTSQTTTNEKDKNLKKYTKRRYTDTRHQTRHIPDAETLESASTQTVSDDKLNSPQVGPVYKRRELISSVPSK